MIGKTTKAEILASYGEPGHQRTVTLSGDQQQKAATPFDVAAVEGALSQLTYSFTQADPAIAGGKFANKTAVFSFWNDTLVSFAFSSSFDAESTDFDESKTSSLKKGVSTKSDVIQLLGPPSGRAIFPMIQPKTGEKFTYEFMKFDRMKRRVTVKRLEILFDAQDRMTDYRLVADERPLPVISTPVAPTVVPIIVPRK